MKNKCKFNDVMGNKTFQQKQFKIDYINYRVLYKLYKITLIINTFFYTFQDT